ncbi:unnamed protein product [Amaranthus hypochondriacus]
MIDDDNVTMIDFPQMVSISHRNAQMYFDRDVECIFKFFRKRFKLTFELQSNEADGIEVDTDDNSRPCFSSILKVADSLDKELSVSGFSQKEQDDLERFIEGDSKDTDSGDEETDNDSGADESIPDNQIIDECNGSDMKKFDSLGFSKQVLTQKVCDAVGIVQISSTAPCSSEVHITSDKDTNSEGDAELTRRLSKQRRRAIASAHRRQNVTSRNSYKDKGRKSSQNSKIQKQFGGW